MKNILFIVTGLLISALGVVLIWNIFFNTTEDIIVNGGIVVNEDLQKELNQISVSVVLHPIRNSGEISTARSDQNILSVLKKTQSIWEPAGIDFDIIINQIELDPTTQQELASGNNRALYSVVPIDDGSLHIFFRKGLTANGLAIGPAIALVNDIISVNDFRATAHEIGHLLGLKHDTISITRLMYQGVNGTNITTNEIVIAREGANYYSKIK